MRDQIDQRLSRPRDHQHAGRQRGAEHAQCEQGDEQDPAPFHGQHEGRSDRGRIQPVDERDAEHEERECLHRPAPAAVG